MATRKIFNKPSSFCLPPPSYVMLLVMSDSAKWNGIDSERKLITNGPRGQKEKLRKSGCKSELWYCVIRRIKIRIADQKRPGKLWASYFTFIDLEKENRIMKSPCWLCLSYQLYNHQTNFQKHWKYCYAIGGHPSVVFYNDLKSVRISRRKRRFLRWERYSL